MQVIAYYTKCDPDVTNKNGDTPLHLACQAYNMYFRRLKPLFRPRPLQVVKYMVNKLLCNPSAQNKCHQTPLHVVCSCTYTEEIALEVVKFLISDTRCDCNAVSIDGDSPLMHLLMTHSDWNKIAHYLICDCHCDLSLKNALNQTALHIACLKKNPKVVKMIIETGFDPNVKDEAGNTPLFTACKHQSTNLASLILESCYCGVEILLDLLLLFSDQQEVISTIAQFMDMKHDVDGNTLLHLICISDFHLARVVAKMNCNPNVINRRGERPLHIACRNGDTEMATVLLGMQDCDVSTQDDDGDTPLHLACRNNMLSVVKLMLNMKPNLHAKNSNGNFPINEALCISAKIAWILLSESCTKSVEVSACSLHSKCDLSLVQQLIEEGLNPLQLLQIDVTNSQNLLHICGQVGDLEALKLLVESPKCYLMPRDKEGWTPLHYAGNLIYLSTEQACDSHVVSKMDQLYYIQPATQTALKKTFYQ